MPSNGDGLGWIVVWYLLYPLALATVPGVYGLVLLRTLLGGVGNTTLGEYGRAGRRRRLLSVVNVGVLSAWLGLLLMRWPELVGLGSGWGRLLVGLALFLAPIVFFTSVFVGVAASSSCESEQDSTHSREASR